MDIADKADDVIAECTADAVRRVVGKSGPEFDSRFNGRDCVECEEPVQPERLALGKVRCIACQVEREKLAKLRTYNAE